MSLLLSTFVGKSWLRLCGISGFWLDPSLDKDLKPGLGYGSLPRLKRKPLSPPGWTGGASTPSSACGRTPPACHAA
eukprot:2925604-Amphidinium_carterae.1